MQLAVEDIIYIHSEILKISGGLSGVRDIGLLESAVNKPHMHVFGVESYRTIYAKAAAILESIALFHPFVDGNKRTAMASADFYLFLNGINLQMTNEEYVTFMLRVVQEKTKVPYISRWLEEHSSPSAK